MKGIENNVDIITSKFATVDNNMGLGKLIYLEEMNETVITNGKSLVTFSNSKLSNNLLVTDEEKYRINVLVTKLIHTNFGENSLCELMLTKTDINDMLDFVYENITRDIELAFNKELEVLLLKTNERVLVKIINSNNINSFKCRDCKVTVEALQLYNVLDVVTAGLNANGTVGLAIQNNNAPLLIESEEVKACVTTIK